MRPPMADKILIVDDEPQVRHLLRTALGKTYEVAEADCGEEALRLGFVTAQEFDRLVRPEKMVRPG